MISSTPTYHRFTNTSPQTGTTKLAPFVIHTICEDAVLGSKFSEDSFLSLLYSIASFYRSHIIFALREGILLLIIETVG